MERGWFRAYVLYLDDEPIAFWQGHAYRGVVLDRRARASTPRTRDLRVGNYVLFKLIADLCADDVDRHARLRLRRRRVQAPLRRPQLARSRTCIVFAPTAKGIRTNAVRSARAGAVAGSRAARCATATALARVKRRWRDRLRSRPADARVRRLVLVSLRSSSSASRSSRERCSLDQPIALLPRRRRRRGSARAIWALLTELDRYDEWNPYITRASGNVEVGARRSTSGSSPPARMPRRSRRRS